MNLLFKNISYLLLAIGIVFVWRGIWGLADLYLLPDNQTLSFILSILLGTLILLVRDGKKRDISELE